jgi:hypothetical protein
LTFAAPQVLGTISPTPAPGATLRRASLLVTSITSVTLGGANPDQFSLNAPLTCTTTTPGLNGTFCTVRVRFAPTVASGAGPKAATINVVTSVGTYSIPISGTAIGMATIGTANTLNLGAAPRVPVNGTRTLPLTVTNTGTDTLNITTAVVVNLTAGNPAFSSAGLGTCAAPVPQGGTCQIPVTFHPIVAGNPILGRITITAASATNSPRVVNLTGRT